MGVKKFSNYFINVLTQMFFIYQIYSPLLN